MIKLLVSVFGVALVGLGLMFESHDSMMPVEGYDIGDAVGEFSLKNIDGKMVALSDYQSSEGVIVIFTCNSCPYAKMYEDRIIQLHEKFEDQGYPVLAIMPNDVTIKPEDSFANMKKRADEKSYGFPYVIDETQDIARRFGATKTPHVFLLNKEGNGMQVSYIGAIDDNPRGEEVVKVKYVEQAIGELKAGKSVSKTKAVAVGCTIKWSK